MSDSTRRGFLKVAGAGAAAGVAAVAVGAAAKSGHKSVEGTATAAELPKHAGGPLVAYVRDVRGAEVSVMVGETEVVVHDADLVARLSSVRGKASA